MNQKEWNEEQDQFSACQDIIRTNVAEFDQKLREAKAEHEALVEAYQSGDGELYDQLIVSQSLVEGYENDLRKNKAALAKPYFGRIDFEDFRYGKQEQMYIGKNGVRKGKTQVIVADWRTPIATVYYDNPMGMGTYRTPDGKLVEIDLQLKRSYDVEKGKLVGFYDSDVASNDELLVKYLSQNKDVVLSDIISTIQKEQNRIIRENPFRNVIVQGVAGSGKTTVALHKISYILYNYAEKFIPQEFCIIGSSDMLLNYITSGLPDLDVHHVGQMRMDTFFQYMLQKQWKARFQAVTMHSGLQFRNGLSYIEALEQFLVQKREQILPIADVWDEEIGVILSAQSMEDIVYRNANQSIVYLLKLCNERILKRITLLTHDEERELRAEKRKQFRNYFGQGYKKESALEIYLDFLIPYAEQLAKKGIEVDFRSLAAIQKGKLDVYDMAAMALIWKRCLAQEEWEPFGQIIIDEAQDFGVMIYDVLHKLMPHAYFTIMGDVSQNVNYDTGMNSWEDLRNCVFNGERDGFYLLSKSYRNTIEISTYAGSVLEQASSGAYKIDPVIRHGMEVQFCRRLKEADCVSLIPVIAEEMKGRQHETIAVVVKTNEEAMRLRKMLETEMELVPEGETFGKGVMILPVALVKGLEFDGVILWQPIDGVYAQNEGDAKLLYVAITRALHELHIVYSGMLSPLLEQKEK